MVSPPCNSRPCSGSAVTKSALAPAAQAAPCPWSIRPSKSLLEDADRRSMRHTPSRAPAAAKRPRPQAGQGPAAHKARCRIAGCGLSYRLPEGEPLQRHPAGADRGFLQKQLGIVLLPLRLDCSAHKLRASMVDYRWLQAVIAACPTIDQASLQGRRCKDDPPISECKDVDPSTCSRT